MFDNDFDAKGRPQLRHEVEDASSNGFVVSCDSLGSNLFHKVSRAGVLWIMYIRQSVNSGPHRLSAVTLRYEELMALSAMIHGKQRAYEELEKECERIGELTLKQTMLLQNDALNRSYVIAWTTSKNRLIN